MQERKFQLQNCVFYLFNNFKKRKPNQTEFSLILSPFAIKNNIFLFRSKLQYLYPCIFNFETEMLSYNDQKSQSSESDVEFSDNIYKATTGYGKIAKITRNQHKYQSSSESQESSLSQNEREEQQSPNARVSRKQTNKIVPIYQRASDSEEEEDYSDNSIDHIEERIKRLEKDLEKKIDKHKKQSNTNEKDKSQNQSSEKLKNLKNNSSPPLPKKMETKAVPIISKSHPEQKIHKGPKESKQPQEKHFEVEDYLPPAPKKQIKNIDQIIEEQKEAKEISPKKKLKQKKQTEEVKNPSNLLAQKKRAESKGTTKTQSNNNVEANYIKKLSKAHKHIEDLTKALQETRKQNKRLKQQVANTNIKKKSHQQVQKLKAIAADTSDVKLQKQIQLLKIIEGLQTKLKKSINKKLGKSRVGSTSAALLHKGLPSSLIH